MLEDNELIINKIAQNILSIEDGILWFDALSEIEKKNVLLRIKFFAEQSRPNTKVIKEAIYKIPLKPTMTPVVLLKKHPFKIALTKIVALPKIEYKKAFTSLITIFKEGDTYRRNTLCKDGCTHEWHNLR